MKHLKHQLKQLVSKSEKDTMEVAYNFAQNFKKQKPNLICLKGKLGAGKTVFVKGFSKVFGIDPLIVKSPTYTYMRKYRGIDKDLYHFDFYRLDKPDNTLIEELIEILENKKAIILIEWPEKIESHLPGGRAELLFDVGDKVNHRLITINTGK